MHNSVVEKMKETKGALIKHAKVANKSVNKVNKTVQVTEKKEKNWGENRNRLDNVVSLACKNFDNEGIMKEMFLEAVDVRVGPCTQRGKTTQTGILRTSSKLFGMVFPDRFKGSISLEI